MILTCPACGAKFNLDDALMPPSGRKVRCGKCAHVWLAAPPPLPMPDEPAPAPAASMAPPIPEAIRPAPPAAKAGKPARTVARAPAAPACRQGFGHALITLLALLAAMAAVLYFLRAQVVMVFPPAEELYERIGIPVGPEWKDLAIVNVSANAVPAPAGATVTISGEVVNRGSKPVRKPGLAGMLRGGETAPVAFSISLQPGMIAPGAREVFSRTLSGVPEKAGKVDIRFAP